MNSSNSAYLSVQGIHKQFHQMTALRDIRIDIFKNEFLCLLGPSGCGKTTLLRIIAGLEQPSGGKVVINGKDMTHLPPSKRNFGMVFQSYALFPNLTAFQNIAYGLKGKGLSKREIEERVNEALALVDLSHAHRQYPAQLSGGQQQRVALARAIVLKPDFLLLDEPLSALDAKVRTKLRRDIRELQERIGITTIMVTHDQEEALTMADRIVVMSNAEVKQVGTPEEVYERPNSPFVADFIGAINFFKGDERQAEAPALAVSSAIRPEHVRIAAAREGNEDSVPAIVHNIEFRGPFYRLTVQVEQAAAAKWGMLPEGLMTVDVSAHVSHQLQLAKNVTVWLEVPEDKRISFSSTHPIEAELKA